MPPIFEVRTPAFNRDSRAVSSLGLKSPSPLAVGGGAATTSITELFTKTHESKFSNGKWTPKSTLFQKELTVLKSKMETAKNEQVQKKKSLSDYFSKEPCLYSHTVYRNAGVLYRALRHEEEMEDAFFTRHAQMNFNMANANQPVKPTVKLPHLEFYNEEERRLTFELAFSTLKYQQVLEEMFVEPAFFSQFPEFKEEEGIATVMLYDFQKRKFQPRVPLNGEELDPLLKDIEKSILSCKTKLNASLAKNRIKANAQSIEHLLPESVRAKDELQNTVPIYAWVNQLKKTATAVMDDLRQEGFQLIANPGQSFTGRCFKMDDHCNDTLVFPPDQLDVLKSHQLVKERELIIQDKSSCLAPHVVKSVLTQGTDIMHVNLGSGLICAHLASLVKGTDSMVIAFGIRDNDHLRRVTDTLEDCGATKYVKIQTEKFKDVEADDAKFRSIRAILLTAECSKSGIYNPIDFILTEGEDTSILKDLSTGDYDISKMGELVAKHNQALKHCMKFNRVHSLVYMTRSIKESENDKVVSKAVEYSNQIQQQKKIPPFKLHRPILPLVTPNRFGEVPDENERLEAALSLPGYNQNHRYIKFDATTENTGCFIAMMVREGEEVKESAKDVLARAAARGLLGPGKVKENNRKHKSKKDDLNTKMDDSNEHRAISDSLLEKPVRRKSESSRIKITKVKSRRPRSWPKKSSGSSLSSPLQYQSPSVIPLQGPTKLSSSLAKSNKKRAAVHMKSFPESLMDSQSMLADPRSPKVPEYQKVVQHPGPFSDGPNPDKTKSSQEKSGMKAQSGFSSEGNVAENST